MEKSWLPQKIGSWPQFLWWELDEVLPVIGGISMFVLKHGWYWIPISVLVSYGYIRIFKKGEVNFNLADWCFGLGVFDLKSLPLGTSRRMRQ